jgi:hypothetical protein
MTGSAELYSVSPALLHNKFHGFFVTTDKYTPDIKGSWVCVRRFRDPLSMNQFALASVSRIGSFAWDRVVFRSMENRRRLSDD